MDDATLLRSWRTRFAEPTTGWSFEVFGDSITADELPWSYPDLARAALCGARSALDIGTGGGEVLLGLADALPNDTVATEGWAPNLPLAKDALAPRGIEVVHYDAEGPDPPLPFADGRFDVVLDGHEAYVASEIARVLRPGGRFVTQQVDGRDFEQTHALFGSENAYVHVTLDRFREDAETAGLEVVEAHDWQGTMWFDDVATLVSYLRMVPWEVPDDFTPDAYAGPLLRLHHSCSDLAFSQRRFALVCRLPRR
ncbi:class I SAM-dependent methyltransferase [Intrasporangium sp.]|uniref:class I SAM-dependent methyltransferase n=1 Tax=Intrasporangium sp. TaxID=1925024 RepID=UPI0032221BC5